MFTKNVIFLAADYLFNQTTLFKLNAEHTASG